MKIGPKITGSRFAFKFDYLKPLLRLIKNCLKNGDIEGTIDILDNYNLNVDV